MASPPREDTETDSRPAHQIDGRPPVRSGDPILVGPNPQYSRAQLCGLILGTTQPPYDHTRGLGLSS